MPIGIRPEYNRGLSTKKIQKKAMKLKESKTAAPEHQLGTLENDIANLKDFQDAEEVIDGTTAPPFLMVNK